MYDLQPAAAQLATLAEGIADDDLGAPTPCPGYSVGDLLDHVMALAVAFRHTAQKSAMPAGESPPGAGSAAHLDPRWRELLPQRLEALAAAWRDPAAWTGTTEAGGFTGPAEVMGLAAVDELVVHGWDLARATRQPFACDPASEQACLAFTSMISAPGMEESRAPGFGPVVAVAGDATPFERVLGMSGRDPAWTAGG